jgi:hypothetical protein
MNLLNIASNGAAIVTRLRYHCQRESHFFLLPLCGANRQKDVAKLQKAEHPVANAATQFN